MQTFAYILIATFALIMIYACLEESFYNHRRHRTARNVHDSNRKS